MSGWVKLHRSLLEWEWWDDHNATRLLIYLLVAVNHEPKKWKGVEIEAGSMVVSWETLSNAVLLTPQQCRTAMAKLEQCGEITRKVTNRFQLVSLVKWGKLQSDNRRVTGKRTDREQTDNRQITTTKEVKETKEGEEVTHAQKLLNWLEENCPDVCKMKEPLTNDQAQSIIDKYPNPNFVAKTFQAMDNYKPLKQKNKSAYKTFLNWASRDFESYKEANGHQPQKKRI